MMDTDKKRKTIRCQKCGLTFSGERVYCPLCKKRIIDEGTADSSIKEDFDVFPVCLSLYICIQFLFDDEHFSS